MGWWLDDDEVFGAELGGSFLASRQIAFGQGSPGTPVIARPFFNVNSQQQDASLVTFPGLASGSIAVQSGTRLYGIDANGLMLLNNSRDYPLRLIAGFRYLDLHDDLNIDETALVAPNGQVYAGQQIGVRDNFSCDNYFYGANLGISGGYNLRSLELQATLQCALGVGQECVTVQGWTSFSGPNGVQQVPGGLLALSSNSGTRIRDVFAVVPEADIDARYAITRHVIVSVGYSFLYWNQVTRAGGQVDTNVNPNLVPSSNSYGQPIVTPRDPLLTIHDTDFWAQGVHFGLELRF